MLLALVSAGMFAACQLTEWEQLILDQHNTWRASTSPPAKGMRKVRWDTNIAKNMASWLSSCNPKWPHSKQEKHRKDVGGYKYLGENTAYCTGIGCPDELADGTVAFIGRRWWKEKKDYDYAKDKSKGPTAHYTQMASSNIYAIGCAIQKCGGPGPSGWKGTWWWLGCQYGERGRGYWNGKRPYEQGSGGLVEPPASVFTKNPGLCKDGGAAVTSSPLTLAPTTPPPVTAAPLTPAPASAASITPSPPTVAPATLSPVTSAPLTVVPATATPPLPTIAPATPAPATSSLPTTAPATATPPSPTTAPVAPAPVTYSPPTPVPATPPSPTTAPVTPAPVTPTPAPATPVPATASPTSPTAAPATPAPATSSPPTMAPATPAPVTPTVPTTAPMTPAPVTTPSKTITPVAVATSSPPTAAPGSPSGSSCALTEWEQLILDQHNTWRASTSPPAKGMRKVRWDTNIAKNMASWLSSCNPKWPHSKQEKHRKDVGGYKYLGENMAYCAGTGCPDKLADGTVAFIGKGWWKEKKDYDYAKDKSKGVTSHYTQMASSNIYAMGCAAQKCGGPGPSGWKGTWWWIGCQYGERGRGYWSGTKPYEQGSGGLVEPPASVFTKNPGLCKDGSAPPAPAPTPLPPSDAPAGLPVATASPAAATDASAVITAAPGETLTPQGTVPPTAPVTGTVVSVTKGPFDKEEHRRTVARLTGRPLGTIDATEEAMPDGSTQVTTTFTGEGGPDSAGVLAAAVSAGEVGAHRPVPTDPADDDDDTLSPVVWVAVAIASIAACLGLVVFTLRSRPSSESVSLQQFLEMEPEADNLQPQPASQQESVMKV